MFKGHKLLVRATCTDGRAYSKFDIIDMSDNNTTLATITPFGIDDTQVTAGNIGVWPHAVVNSSDENKLDLYIFKPAVGAAKYSITATEILSYTDPVQSLKATRQFNTDGTQNAVLTWAAPATGASYVSAYNIYEGSTLVATVGADVLTWTDTDFTASTTYNVVPTYSTGTTGTDATVTLAPFVYTAPQNVAVTNYDGYTRAAITFSKVANTGGLTVRYDIVRNDAVISAGLAQNQYVDTYVPAGEYTYAIEAVYYMNDENGEATIEIARVRSDSQTITMATRNTALVNYTLEEVYNYDMWEIWDWNQSNGGATLPSNFNPNSTDATGTKYLDAELYRQGALVTDSNGKKWWYIAQRTTTSNVTPQADDMTSGSGGILKISAESDRLQAGGDAEMLTLPIAMKSSQSVGIAVDEEYNVFVRGHDGSTETSYAGYANYTKPLTKGVIYKADMSKGYTVDLSSVEFCPENPTAAIRRCDYYSMEGKLFTDGEAYLYASAHNSRTMTRVTLKYDSSTDAVTVDSYYQYTPTTLEDGTTIAQTSYENYVFPVAEGQGTAGYIQYIRSIGYFYVPTGATTNDQKTDIFTGNGVATAGGNTVRMVTDAENNASQLFIITPQSFYSKNIGSFVVNVVTQNDFTTGVVPIASYIQTDMNADGTATNSNGNWLFAEYDTDAKCIYIYQYVPGIRIAKYRLYGNIGFLDSMPTLDIDTQYDNNDKDNITHFTATTTWSTPADYQGAGDYAISYYLVELLDHNNNVIDSRKVTATEGFGSDWSKQDYSLTFNTTADLTNGGSVAVGDGSNHFVDNASEYIARVTAVYDLTLILNGTSTANSDERSGATNSVMATHDYDVKDPAGSVQIYTGTGSVKGAYRVEIDITNMEEGEEPVSYYTLAYTYTDGNNNTVTKEITDFVLVSTDGNTENQSAVPGTLVRNDMHAVAYPEDATNTTFKSYVMFAVDNRTFVENDGYYYRDEESWEIPTNWTYTINAVYAADNSLLRKTTVATLASAGDAIQTGVEELAGDNVSLKAFPIPAVSTVTVQAPQAIGHISIVSAAGVEVKSIAGNGDNVMSIAVDDLTPGYYMLRVDNMAPIKIVKK